MYEELYSFVVIINVNYLLLKDNNKYNLKNVYLGGENGR